MNVEKMFTSIDVHVAGEAYRVIVHSPLQLVDKKTLLEAEHDAFLTRAKQLLLNEPRGHRGMNGCIVMPSNNADFSVLLFNPEQETYFSYSGLVAAITMLLETGQLAVKEDGVYKIETLKGVYSVSVDVAHQVVEQVQIESDLCQVLETKEDFQLVEVDQSRRYLLYPLPDSIPTLEVAHLLMIQNWGKQMIEKHQDTDYDGVVLIEQRSNDVVRSVTFKKDGYILRSPGFDTLFAIYTSYLEKGEPLERFSNQSIFGSELTAEKSGSTMSNRFSVKSRGFITGEHRFLYDVEDPLEKGFLLK